MTILENLYNGNINPSERYMKRGGEYYKTVKKLNSLFDEFFPLLNKDTKAIYEKIEKLLSELNYISEKEAFIDGFSIGAQITTEIYKNDRAEFTNNPNYFLESLER